MVELRHTLGRERLDLPRVDDALAEEAGDPVVGRVAQDGGGVEHDERRPQVQTAPVSREDASREQKRIARQKREEHKARLHEHDQEQRGVHPCGAQRHDPPCNRRAGVGKETDEEVDDVHSVLTRRGPCSKQAARGRLQDEAF